MTWCAGSRGTGFTCDAHRRTGESPIAETPSGCCDSLPAPDKGVLEAVGRAAPRWFTQFTPWSSPEPSEALSGGTFDDVLDRGTLHTSVTEPMGHGINAALATFVLRGVNRAGAGLGEPAHPADHERGHANRPASGRRRPSCPRTPPELSLIGNGRILRPPSLVLPGGRNVTREATSNCVKAGRTWHGTAGGAGTARCLGRRSG
jgi:hypothetical protein